MHLDVTESEVVAIKRNHPHDYEHQKFQVLSQWKLKRGQFQGTFKALIDVFTELHDHQQMVDTIRREAAEAHKGSYTYIITVVSHTCCKNFCIAK